MFERRQRVQWRAMEVPLALLDRVRSGSALEHRRATGTETCAARGREQAWAVPLRLLEAAGEAVVAALQAAPEMVGISIQ
jgi:hypothetical protein